MVMHRTLKEMPGPRAEMSAVIAHWDPAIARAASRELRARPTDRDPRGRLAGEARGIEGRGLGGRSARIARCSDRPRSSPATGC